MKKMRPVEVKLLAPSSWVEGGKPRLSTENCTPSTPLPPTGFHCLFPIGASVLGGVLAPCQSSCLPLALSHQHCLLPSAAGAVGSRQQRGPHSYPKVGYYHCGASKIQKNTDHSGYPVTHREGRKKWKEWYTVKVLATWGQANIIIIIKLKMALHAVYQARCSWEYRCIVLSVTIQGIICWLPFLHASPRKEKGQPGKAPWLWEPQAGLDRSGRWNFQLAKYLKSQSVKRQAGLPFPP